MQEKVAITPFSEKFVSIVNMVATKIQSTIIYM